MSTIVEVAEKLFESFPFAKECVLIFLSVILGGICTAAINNGAMRKKCRFDIQYGILQEAFNRITEFEKALEKLEIGLSFIGEDTVDFKVEAQSVVTMALKINEMLREKRKFIRKHLSAIIVEESAQIVSDIYKVMYRHGDGGIFDLQVIDKVDGNTLQGLRNLEADVRKLSNTMAESLEKLIAPSLFSKMKRKLRKIGMVIEECYAIYVVQRKKNKEIKKGTRQT